MIDGAIGRAYGVTASSVLLSLGVPPATAAGSKADILGDVAGLLPKSVGHHQNIAPGARSLEAEAHNAPLTAP